MQVGFPGKLAFSDDRKENHEKCCTERCSGNPVFSRDWKESHGDRKDSHEYCNWNDNCNAERCSAITTDTCSVEIVEKINSVCQAKRPIIHTKVFGHPVNWLADSGAAITVACSELERRWGGGGENSRARSLPIPSDLSIRSASKHFLHIEKILKLPIEVAGKIIEHPVIFVRGLQSKAIIGMDFMRKHGALIDAKTNRVTFEHELRNKGEVESLKTKLRNDLCNDIKVAKSVIIPPMCQAKILLHANKRHTTGVTLAPDCRIPEAIVKTGGDGNFYSVITNSSVDTLEFIKGELMGQFEEITDPSKDVVSEVSTMDKILTGQKKQGNASRKYKSQQISEEVRKMLKQTVKVTVPQEYEEKYWNLIYKFGDCFSRDKNDLGSTDVIEHDIKLKHDDPIHMKQFRIPWEQIEFINDFVTDMLQKKCIRPSMSPYNAPIFCVKKPHGGGWRIVLDFRQLNLASKEDKYVIREIRDCIDAIGRRKSRIFTTWDLTSGFWQCSLKEEARKYTAFTVPGRGRYEWTKTPMGLTAAPSTFSRLMDHVMCGLEGVLTYIDDVLIHSRNHDEHLHDLELAFQRIRKYGLKLSPAKCQFAAKEVAYLGYTLTEQGVKPGYEKLEAVKNFPVPKTIKNIREFCGLCNYFSHMMPNYVQLAGQLTELTKKNSGWKEGELPERAKEAFERLKDTLCKQPVVAFPRGDRDFILSTDAATGDKENVGGLGAILSQIDESGRERAVGYASRALKTHEKNYGAFLLEMAAASWGIDYFSVYLIGRRFTLYTDHRPMETMSTIHKKTLNRLQHQMLEYNFQIRYRQGCMNEAPDALSRNVAAMSLERETTDVDMESAELFALQQNEQLIKNIAVFLKTKKMPTNEEQRRETADWARFCYLSNNLVYFSLSRKGRRGKLVLWAPKSMTPEIIKAAHSSFYGGHASVERTVERITGQWWWPQVSQEVNDFVRKCIVCLKTKDPYGFQSRKAPMGKYVIPDRPNVRVHVDLFGPLKTVSGAGKYVMVMTDAFTKYVELAIIDNKEMETVGWTFFKRWICRHTCPEQLVTDRGKEFDNKLMKDLAERCGMEKWKTSAMRPQSNGQVERFNRTMVQYLKWATDGNSLDWTDYIPMLAISYNTSVHKQTKESPFFLTFCHEPRLPYFDMCRPKMWSDSWSSEKLQKMKETYEMVQARLESGANKNKEYGDRKAISKNFQVGEKVLVHFPKAVFSGNKKIIPNWMPDFIIHSRKDRETFEVRHIFGKKRPTIVHSDRLKRQEDEIKPPPKPRQTEEDQSQSKTRSTKEKMDSSSSSEEDEFVYVNWNRRQPRRENVQQQEGQQDELPEGQEQGEDRREEYDSDTEEMLRANEEREAELKKALLKNRREFLRIQQMKERKETSDDTAEAPEEGDESEGRALRSAHKTLHVPGWGAHPDREAKDALKKEKKEKKGKKAVASLIDDIGCMEIASNVRKGAADGFSRPINEGMSGLFNPDNEGSRVPVNSEEVTDTHQIISLSPATQSSATSSTSSSFGTFTSNSGIEDLANLF